MKISARSACRLSTPTTQSKSVGIILPFFATPLALTGLPVKFSPGQWLDTYIPGLEKAGGFTITSTPSEARPSSHSPAFLELAVSCADS